MEMPIGKLLTVVLVSIFTASNFQIAPAAARQVAAEDATEIHHRVRRVIGGTDYDAGTWPWLVSLQGKIPTQTLFGVPLAYQRYYCGASLLNDRWILTAAHCFVENTLGAIARTPKYWHARLGEVSLKRTAMDRVSDWVGKVLDVDKLRHYHLHAEKIFIHPNYDERNMWQNDIALVKLEEDVPSGASVNPLIQSIQLINANNFSFPTAGQSCVMKGWGCTENGGGVAGTARQVTIPKISDEECRRVWGIPATARLCAGYNAGGNLGICSGDSGGPLVCHNGVEWIQVGIASFTSASKPAAVPGVFTRVSHYIPWIRKTIASN